MRSDTGTVHECGPSAKCEFHGSGGSLAQPCSPVGIHSFFLRPEHGMEESVRFLEAWFIESAMKRAGGNTKQAAELLGLTRQGLEFHLEPKKGRHKDLHHLIVKRKYGSRRKTYVTK